MSDKEKMSWDTQMELNKTTGIMLGLLQHRLDSLEKKVGTLDLEKKLKLDYMLKMNQLEKNDKTHQALYDKLFKEIAILQKQINELEKLKNK